MSKELVIGSNRHETKVAVLEDDQLVEVYFQRANEYSLAGSIHKGRVTRVLPGMQSAFVDIGLERDTFLYVSDFFEEHPDVDTLTDEKAPRSGRPERSEVRLERDRELGGDREGSEARQDRDPRQERDSRPNRDARSERDRGNRDSRERQEVRLAPAVEAATSSVPSATETGEGEQVAATENKSDFSFDRRNRRSRRRRTRGRGFPENKYAQAGSDASPVAEAPPELEEQEEESVQDVIVLPGESLAKYRNRPVITEEESASASSAEEVESEEVNAAAAELAIARKEALVSPHPYSDIEMLEGAVPLEEDEPVSVGSSRIREDFSIHLVSGDDSEAVDLVEESEVEPEPEEEVLQHHVPSEALTADLPESEHVHEELTTEETPDLEVFPLVSSAPIEEIAEDAETESEESEGQFLEERLETGAVSEPEEDEAVAAEEPVAALEAQAGEPQSAVVREPSGRSMHRVSRRMRRRRGGNRFNHQSGNVVGNGDVAESTSAGAGPAAAETRPDVENRSARDEQRIAPKPELRPERVSPSISELLKAGQEIIVQIAKEPLGQKGARITSHVALPGRYVVYMPSVEHLGVSRKIASDDERYRLKKILQAHRVGTTGGFIVRTAGEGRTEDEIAADMNFLYNLWLDIRQKAEKKPAPLLLHHDLDVVHRILRDQLTDDYKAIWTDSEDMYESVLRFVQRFQPSLVNRVKMYTRSAPVFDAFNITQELEKALRPKVWLKSGGYIVINQTEALVAIDVNTGKFVGKSNRLEDTIVKTNTEAVKEIVRQIRLRDLGGIIVVDFIDMDERKNRQKVMQALEEAMRADKAPYKILQFNDFGLVAITRKRVKQSLERTLCAPCPHCEGAGYVKSVQTVISEILVEAQKLSVITDEKNAVLRCHPEVAKTLKSKDNQYLEELEETLGRTVLVTSDPLIHQEKFDLA